jgi:hypothetical protein
MSLVELATVRVANSYVCGRQSGGLAWVSLPDHGEDADEWYHELLHDLTGDGHPCGEREHALYEVTVIAAPGRPDLVGATFGSEG